MKRLSFIFTFILSITSNAHQIYGIDVNIEKEFHILTTFQMKVLYDGFPCEDSVFVSLKIYSNQNKILATWTHAYCKLFDERGIGVRVQHFTTFNDTITNLKVGENSFEFNLHCETEASLRIVGVGKDDIYHIEGIGFLWDDIFKRKVDIKWYSIDTIPYQDADREVI